MTKFHASGYMYLLRFMLAAAAALMPASALTRVLNSVSPSTIQAGSTTTLTLNGSNFASGDTVSFAGSVIFNAPGCSNCPITYVSSTQMMVVVTAPTSVGTYTIQVETSNKLNVGVVAGGTNPVPSLTSLSPAAATAGGVSFTLTLTGSNFVSGSLVRWNGFNRATNYINSTQLTASIPASDIANAGTVNVTVFNPAPGGGTSNALIFTINTGSSVNPNAPTFSLWPSSATAGGAQFTLTVYGGGFTSGSHVYWNGSSRSTTFVSSTTLQATITASDIANAGSARVSVFPSPAGLSSRGAVFLITSSQSSNLAPRITWVTPITTTSGGSAKSLNIYGSNFISGSTVRWNGVELATTFLNTNQLTVQVPATNIASPGTAWLTPFDPYAGGGVTGYAGEWLYPITTPGVTTFVAGPQPTGMAPVAAAVDAVLHRIYVVHRGAYRDVGVDSALPTDVLSVVDQLTGNIITTIGLGSSVNGLDQGIAVDETRHFVYVTNADDNTVSVIDGTTNITVNTVAVDQNPHGIAVDPAGGIVYVAGDNVTLLDATQNGKFIGSVAVGGAARAVAVDRSTHLGYVLVLSVPTTVVAVDGAARNIKSQVSLPDAINTYTAIAVDAGFRAYAADYNTGTITPINISNSSSLTLLTGFNGGAQAHDLVEGIAVDPNTHFVYVVDSSGNSVSIFTSSGTPQATISVLRLPTSIALDPVSGLAYVTDAASDSLSVLDMTHKTLSGTIPLGVLGFDIALDTTAKRLYAGNFAADAISVLDATNQTVTGSWLSGAGVWAVAVDPGLQFVYGLNTTEGTLSVLKIADGSVRALQLGPITTGMVAVHSTTHMVYVSGGASGVIIVNPNVNPPQIVTTVPVGGTPVGIAIDETAGWVYVGHTNSNNSGGITVLDAVTNHVLHTWQTTQPLWKLAVDHGLGHLYATLPTIPGSIGGTTGLLVFNSSTGEFITQVASGVPTVAPPEILSNAENVAVNPANHHVFFTNSENGTVTVVNGSTYAVIKTFVTGTATNGLAVDSAAGLIYVANPFDATIGVFADPATPNNPVPTLTSLNPANVTAGGAMFTLTVNGTNFISGSTIRWNGSSRTTAFISTTQLQAAILAGDIATAGSAQITVSNPGPGGGLSNSLSFTVNGQSFFRAPGDLDGNGVPDVIWQNDLTRQVYAWYMGGALGNTFLGATYLAPTGMAGWSIVGVVDLNGDHIPDLLWQNDLTRQVYAWYMGGALSNTFLGATFLASSGMTGWTVVAVADVNGDGHPDLIWQNDTTRQIFAWYMGGPLGNNFLGATFLAPTGMSGWKVVAIVDVNGDGHRDLVWQSESTRQVFVWYMGGPLGNNFLGATFLAPTGMTGWTVAGMADFNGDGGLDLLWQNDVTRQVYVWYMGGPLGNTFLGAIYLAANNVSGWTLKTRY